MPNGPNGKYDHLFDDEERRILESYQTTGGEYVFYEENEQGLDGEDLRILEELARSLGVSKKKAASVALSDLRSRLNATEREQNSCITRLRRWWKSVSS